jgi:hypothetical protein
MSFLLLVADKHNLPVPVVAVKLSVHFGSSGGDLIERPTTPS